MPIPQTKIGHWENDGNKFVLFTSSLALIIHQA